jgi:hypothetical protein
MGRAQAAEQPAGTTLFERAWHISAPLTATAVAMVAVLGVAIAGLLVDSRMVTGAPIWLKPAKFAVSIIIYTLTVVWAFHHLPAWTRTRAVVGWTTAITLVLEIVIIVGQVIRGTSSHFNVATPLDAALWSTMGMAIAVQTLASLVLAVALWRARVADRAMGWALRLGLTISILGAATGGLMTGPTASQLEGMRTGERPPTIGAHTVGGRDGGPGLAGTGWSTEHGDLRVPHFVGLHAFQALPLVALAARRRGWPVQRQIRITLVAAVSYGLLFVTMVAQALRGQSIVRPDSVTLMIGGGLLLVSMIAAWIAVTRDELPYTRR